MCIAIYKPAGVAYPSKRTLRICFENNPDGAGYMHAINDRVHIHKGFGTFSAFWKNLQRLRAVVGDAPAAVLHFRISTQAGVRPDCTHPFPLSRDMNDLRRLSCTADIGIAHNGVISLCSSYYSRAITHSDTMEFITTYAARIIKGRAFADDKDATDLLSLLAGSRLAILDGSGRCTLIGQGWQEHEGCVYSNASYKERPRAARVTTALPPVRAYDWSAYGASAFCSTEGDDDAAAGVDFLFDYEPMTCPVTAGTGDLDTCEECASRAECWGY